MAYNRREFMAASAAATVMALAGASCARATNPSEMNIAEAGPLIRSGALSPVELVESYLARIDKLEPSLNAFITLTSERAMGQARALEAELQTGGWRGPLHGIPIALKDNIDTAGIRTTAASAAYQDRIPDEDAEVVKRLEAAGAILLGKLNMHEFAFGASSTISHYGPVHNPWDLDRIPGGSSGGAGAAVAAHLCAGALGTDTGGSVRIPAAHCGIVGLKPTYGLASVRGIIPFSATSDHVGPMCRTVADSALMLQAIAGHDAGDKASIKADIPDYAGALSQRVSGLQLGVPRALFFEDVDAETLAAVEAAISLIAGMTASVEDVELPPLPRSLIGPAEAYMAHKDLIADRGALIDPTTLQRIMLGARMSAEDYAAARDDVTSARTAIKAVFEKVDLLITPTVQQLPVTIEEALASPPSRALIRNPLPFNTYGIPAISLPCGFSQNGLPIGLQIAGPALGESNVIALAHAYEQATEWHKRRPPLT